MATLSRQKLFGIDRRALLVGAAFLGGSAFILGAVFVGEVRIAVTAVVFFLLFALSMIDIRLSILGLFAFLTVLGDVRRLLVPLVGWSGSDPILMVGPVFTVLIMAYAITSRRIQTSSRLSRLMLLFTGLMILQIVNPKQGGLAVGIAGALLVIVPTFWFWIGQAFGSEGLLRKLLFSVVIPLSVLAIAMGFVQLASGYLPYQLAWYHVAGYSALGDTVDTLRPISIFPNISEYLLYVAVAVAVLTSALLHPKAPSVLKQAAFILVPIGLIALLLAGSRGPVVMSVVVIVLLWAVQGKTVSSWVPRLAIAGVLGAMGFVWSLNQATTIGGSERVQANLERQAALVETGGTAGIHAGLAYVALYHGIVKEPLGTGIGSITLAASKFGGHGFNSEKDITNMFIANGVVGGVLYLVILFTVAMTAIRYWIRTRSLIALSLVAMLAVTGLSWLHPGHYVTTPLVWFAIGVLDHLTSDASTDASANGPAQGTA